MSRLQAKSFRVKASARRGHHHQGRRAPSTTTSRVASKIGMWPVKLVDGFRRMLVGLFAFPPRQPSVTFSDDHRYGGSGGGDAPKRSCSSNLHPLNAHYDEAIADCVEFFNKSGRVDVRSRPQF